MSIDISEEAGVRYLHFGSSWVQGAMRIARPFALELDYTREMMTPLLLHGAHRADEAEVAAHIAVYTQRLGSYPHRPELDELLYSLIDPVPDDARPDDEPGAAGRGGS